VEIGAGQERGEAGAGQALLRALVAVENETLYLGGIVMGDQGLFYQILDEFDLYCGECVGMFAYLVFDFPDKARNIGSLRVGMNADEGRFDGGSYFSALPHIGLAGSFDYLHFLDSIYSVYSRTNLNIYTNYGSDKLNKPYFYAVFDIS